MKFKDILKTGIKKINKMRSTTKLIVFLIVVIIILFVFLGKTLLIDTKATKLGFEDIGILETQEVYCTEVQSTRAFCDLFGWEIPFTSSRNIYSYDIVIRAGIDFSLVEYEVNKNEVNIKIPTPYVTSSAIIEDSMKIFIEEESIFRPITLEETSQARIEMLNNAQLTAIENGLLIRAEENAEIILKGFFSKQYDPNEYEYNFSRL